MTDQKATGTITADQFITACSRMASYYGITLPDTMTQGDAVRALDYAGVTLRPTPKPEQDARCQQS